MIYEKIIIEKYDDLERLKDYQEKDLVVDVESCPNLLRNRVIDFLAGITLLGGKLEKKE